MSSMLRISSVWFCVLVLSARAMPSAEPDAFLRDIKPAIATIVTYDQQRNSLNKGSGFFINGQGHLITNYDILKGAHSAEVITYDGNDYPVKLVLAENADSSLAMVAVDIPEDAVKFIRRAETAPKVTERVIAIDGATKTGQDLIGGIIIAVRDIPSAGKVCQISAPVSTGAIGGPVLNIRAEVVGVAVTRTIEGQTVNFAVPIRSHAPKVPHATQDVFS